MSLVRTLARLPHLLASGLVLLVLVAAPTELGGQSEPDPNGEAAAPATAALSTPSGSPDEPRGEAPSWSEQIVVTASRGERAAGEVPLHVVVLDPLDLGSAIDFAASDLVSREVPSLNLQVEGSGLISSPREQSLNMRGVSGSSVSHALLLVDGLPMLDPYNASAIWSKVPNALIERVEVVPGGGATVWGNLALSGVVNLITRAASGRALDLDARLAGHSTTAATAIYSDVAGKWSGWVALDHFATDGYPAVEVTSRGPADEPEFRRYHSLTADASYALSPSALLHLRALGYRENRGEGTRLDRSENRDWMASAAADFVADSGGSSQFRLFARRQALDDVTGSLDDAHTTVVPSSDIFDLTSESVGASAVWSRARGERQTLTAGADLHLVTIDRRENLDYDGTIFTQRYDVAGKQQIAGGFVESRWQLASRWSAQASARLDAIRTSDGESTRTDLSTGAVSERERLATNTDSTFNPSLGFVFQATPASRLRGAIYTGFRAPAPSELFVGAAPRNNRETAPNPDLEPEKLIGGEAGYDLSPSSRFDAHLTGFWSETKNLIDRITLGRVGSSGGFLEPCGSIGPNGSCTQRRNLGATRAYGIELDGEARPHPRWRIQFGAALLETRVVENPALPALVGNEIEHTPRDRVTLGVAYHDPSGFAAAVRVRRVGEVWTETENEVLLPAHTICDLTLSLARSRRLEIFGGVENLFDQEYRVDFASEGFIVGPRRIFQLGVRFRSGGGS